MSRINSITLAATCVYVIYKTYRITHISKQTYIKKISRINVIEVDRRTNGLRQQIYDAIRELCIVCTPIALKIKTIAININLSILLNK